jgi:hypothetical protein
MAPWRVAPRWKERGKPKVHHSCWTYSQRISTWTSSIATRSASPSLRYTWVVDAFSSKNPSLGYLGYLVEILVLACAHLQRVLFRSHDHSTFVHAPFLSLSGMTPKAIEIRQVSESRISKSFQLSWKSMWMQEQGTPWSIQHLLKVVVYSAMRFWLAVGFTMCLGQAMDYFWYSWSMGRELKLASNGYGGTSANLREPVCDQIFSPFWTIC